MLVLSRKTSERILVGDEITITIVRIGSGTVRIGIDAPRDMNVVREEIARQAQQPIADFRTVNKEAISA